MLHLYQSNRLEYLFKMLATVFQHDRHENPFAQEIVVVQSKGMGRWLNFRLAQSRGIAANMQYPLPASFFWDILNRMLGEQRRRSAFSPDVMTFRIMRWLEDHQNLGTTPRVQQYLEEGSDFRRYELANRLADAFDQYLVYRPDWLHAWEAKQPALNLNGQVLLDEDAQWQAHLWRDLVQESEHDHRARSLVKLQAMLEAGEGIDQLPKRVSLVGISSLPPVYMNLLKALSQHINVFFFALNPCAMPWGEIRDEAEQERIAEEHDPADLYLDVGHPLLARWGKQGRDFFDSLLGEAELHSVFNEEEQPNTLLSWLQHDILNLIERNEDQAVRIAENDRSLQIHVCHSPMREIEVLHDQLLALFANDKTLKPSDVVVLTPDIETYAPTIEAVFAPSIGTPTTPFSIADRTYGKASTLTQVFISLLDLPQSRFTVNSVLDLLNVEAIRRRFEIQEDELPWIQHWVKETQIRWGRHAAHKAHFGLPETGQNTWQEGLSRLLIGIGLPHKAASDGLPLYQDILPFEDIEGSTAQTAAHLSRFVKALFKVAESMKDAQPLSEWVARLLSMVETLFDPQHDDDTAAVQHIRECIQTLGELGDEAHYNQAIELSVPKTWLKTVLESKGGEGGFLTGGVTFCKIVPMRNLPFKVVCLLGLDHNTFPHQHRPQCLDLIARYPRKGDRSRRADDRFLLLETLLSARKTLYFSYVGKDIRKDTELPPSILIADLLDVISKGFLPHETGSKPADQAAYRDWHQKVSQKLLEQIRTYHPLQPFDSRYFTSKAIAPGFSEGWCKAAQRAGRGTLKARVLCEKSLPISDDTWKTIELEQLSDALLNPAKYLLRQRCGLTEPYWNSELLDTEPFGLEYNDKSHLRWQALRLLDQGRSNSMAVLARATGRLPHGEWGTRLVHQEHAVVERLHQQARPFLEAEYLPEKPWRLKCQDAELVGWLKDVRHSGYIVMNPQSISAYGLLPAWLNHLALSIYYPNQATTVLIDEKAVRRFKRCHTPETYLRDLVTIYKQSLQEPLPLFRKTSSAFAEILAKAIKDAQIDIAQGDEGIEPVIQEALDDARKAAQNQWNGPWTHTGGKQPAEWQKDSWIERIWRNVDPFSGEHEEKFYTLAQRVWLPLYRHLEEVSE